MIQDRNIHRDAQALRKSLAVPLTVPAFGVNQDEPIFAVVPRYNWRLSDFSTFVTNLSTAVLTVSAQAVPKLAAVGSPRIIPGAAVTMARDEFWFRTEGAGSFFANIAANPVQEFNPTELFTVLDGFWGVFLLVVDQSGNVDQISNHPIQAFGTREIALANCPKVRNPNNEPAGIWGRVAIGVIHAVGGDFIAGTTFTNVNTATFEQEDQSGHVASIFIGSSPHTTEAVLGQQLKDASETNILQGKGGPDGDAVVVMTKCFGGASVLTGPAVATVDYRPWPSGGEGLGDTSVSQNRPSFVP